MKVQEANTLSVLLQYDSFCEQGEDIQNHKYSTMGTKHNREDLY